MSSFSPKYAADVEFSFGSCGASLRQFARQEGVAPITLLKWLRCLSVILQTSSYLIIEAVWWNLHQFWQLILSEPSCGGNHNIATANPMTPRPQPTGRSPREPRFVGCQRSVHFQEWWTGGSKRAIPVFPNVELLCEWYPAQRDKGIIIENNDLCKKAEEIFTKINLAFKPSVGWITRFKQQKHLGYHAFTHVARKTKENPEDLVLSSHALTTTVQAN